MKNRYKKISDFSQEEILKVEEFAQNNAYYSKYRIALKLELLFGTKRMIFIIKLIHGMKYWASIITKDFVNYKYHEFLIEPKFES